jgi:cell division protein FtsQ
MRTGRVAPRLGGLRFPNKLPDMLHGLRVPEIRLPKPRLPVVAIALLLLGAGYATYTLWVRDLSLFSVKHVEITGLEGREAPAIRRALRQTAMRMTTLHVRPEELERAVDSFAAVRSVSASADFPRTLHIRVNEYEPVAALVARDGRRAAISNVHTILRTVDSKAALPTVEVSAIPTSGSLEDATARRLVSALAAAPRQLRRLIARAYATAHGLRIRLRKGPLLYFGSPSRLAAKWAAASRVLADEASRGARFIDVRLPERPVAGGFEPGAGSTGDRQPLAGNTQL